MENQPYSYDAHEFDAWAPTYDSEVSQASGFPFTGYHAVLDELIRQAEAQPGMRVLDLGTGTGNLLLRFHTLGCTLWATDYAPEMLKLAREKVPQATCIQADLRGDWPAGLERLRFDRIVSAYVFHHFLLPRKLELISSLAARLSPGGRILIADLSFENTAHRDHVRQKYRHTWDEEEYWLVDQTLPALRDRGLQAAYRQVSECAGVYNIQPAI